MKKNTAFIAALLLSTSISYQAQAQYDAAPTTENLRDKLRAQIEQNRAARTGKSDLRTGETGKSLRDYRGGGRASGFNRPQGELQRMREETLQQRQEQRDAIQGQREDRREVRQDLQEERRGLHDELMDHRKEMRNERREKRQDMRQGARPQRPTGR